MSAQHTPGLQSEKSAAAHLLSVWPLRHRHPEARNAIREFAAQIRYCRAIAKTARGEA